MRVSVVNTLFLLCGCFQSPVIIHDHINKPFLQCAHTHNTTHMLSLSHTPHTTLAHARTHTHIADPYGIVSISRYSHTTRVVEQSVCPTWDQTIILDDIFLFGNPDSILQSPPICTVEFYDKDLIVRRGLCKIARPHHSCSYYT